MNGSIRMGAIEMYESPISIEHVPPEIVWDDFTDAMAKAGAKKLDEMILKAVGEVRVNVDPDELEKALQYDRDQFQKGFAAGVEWASPKWISVKDRFPEDCIDQSKDIKEKGAGGGKGTVQERQMHYLPISQGRRRNRHSTLPTLRR